MGTYYNSNEPKGSDANCLMSDDFEAEDTGGSHWFYAFADNLSPPADVAQTKGWNGYPNVPLLNNGAINGAGIGGGWCATHGFINNPSGGGSTNEADHNLSSDGINATGVTECYIRWYQKWLTGYIYAGEKCVTVNRTGSGGAGIWFGNCGINTGIGTPSSNGDLQWGHIDGAGAGETARDIIRITTGEWMFIEIRCKLSSDEVTADGTLQIWCDPCGTDGLSPPSVPTLRIDEQDSLIWHVPAGETIGNIWVENFSNSSFGGSTGTSYVDNVIVSTQPIGFFVPPAAGVTTGNMSLR